MNFEKWQALGNDYLIMDDRALPFELTPERIRQLCSPHTGLGSDGILLLAASDEPGIVASMRIFNPDGSEAGLSGNGARQAILFLRRRRWTSEDHFSISTLAGEIRATITSPTTCTVDMGRARLSSEDFPDGPEDGRGELNVAGRVWQFQHVQIGNPQCAIHIETDRELQLLDLGAIGPALEHHHHFPNRTNISWYTVLEPGRIRARIFERGVGETTASGTGATGAAVAYVLNGGDSPVTVVLDGGELEVEVGEDLHVNLSGWAVPVARGTFAEELMEALRATE
ncbi:MAG TPA: diaminopimelate epimerase [Solirubrobacteraceae bacterium]|nr:diaminopimelate epimerase [Solirubrobacteraceae bacterium]